MRNNIYLNICEFSSQLCNLGRVTSLHQSLSFILCKMRITNHLTDVTINIKCA